MHPEPLTVARTSFGIDGEASELGGEFDRNWCLLARTGSRFVLRLTRRPTPRAKLEFQNHLLRTLHEGLGGTPAVPVPVPGLTGSFIVDLGGWYARMFTWVAGATWRAAGRPAYLAADLGHHAGRIVEVLAAVPVHAAPGLDLWDITCADAVIAEYRAAIPDAAGRALVDTIRPRIAELDWERLPRQVIHNDLNDDNVLVRAGAVSGVVDVGDATATVRVAEPAIAAAYAMQAQADPVGVGCSLLTGFAGIVRCTESEIEAVFDLILARLAVSVAVAAARGSENSHHARSQLDSRNLLEELAHDGGRHARPRLQDALRRA